MNDLGLGQIEENLDYNFKHKYDEENEIYTGNLNSCKYFEPSSNLSSAFRFRIGYSRTQS